MEAITFSGIDRARIARRGRYLELLTILWAGLEAAIALITAAKVHNLSLAGFGFDALIEMISGLALLWRMCYEMEGHKRHQAERISLRIAGSCLLTLAAYILIEVLFHPRGYSDSSTGWQGIGITTAALIFMPLLARAKRNVGRALDSAAMMTDAKQTDYCMYQAAIVLFGLLVHSIFGIGWADRAAALLLVPFLVWAGILSLRGEACCSHHCEHHLYKTQKIYK